MSLNTCRKLKSVLISLKSRQPTPITDNKLKVIGWFIIVNIAITLSFTIISAGELLRVIPVLLLLGFLVPFIELVSSRYIAKRGSDIRLIDSNTYESHKEKQLYEIVKVLCKNANLPFIPEVGIYEDDEMNAFTTGFTKKKSIIAFSSEIVENMDDSSLAAVAAHEVSHIANGDMLISTLVQSVMNVFIYLITIPLLILNILAFFSDELDEVCFNIIYFIRIAIKNTLMFLGSLVTNLFSRQREFKADKLAALLVDKNSMIAALKELGEQDLQLSKRQVRYATLKITGKIRFWEIFSTHPSIEKRIKRLMELR